jgi:hypothetical protein
MSRKLHLTDLSLRPHFTRRNDRRNLLSNFRATDTVSPKLTEQGPYCKDRHLPHFASNAHVPQMQPGHSHSRCGGMSFGLSDRARVQAISAAHAKSLIPIHTPALIPRGKLQATHQALLPSRLDQQKKGAGRVGLGGARGCGGHQLASTIRPRLDLASTSKRQTCSATEMVTQSAREVSPPPPPFESPPLPLLKQPFPGPPPAAARATDRDAPLPLLPPVAAATQVPAVLGAAPPLTQASPLTESPPPADAQWPAIFPAESRAREAPGAAPMPRSEARAAASAASSKRERRSVSTTCRARAVGPQVSQSESLRVNHSQPASICCVETPGQCK